MSYQLNHFLRIDATTTSTLILCRIKRIMENVSIATLIKHRRSDYASRAIKLDRAERLCLSFLLLQQFLNCSKQCLQTRQYIVISIDIILQSREYSRHLFDFIRGCSSVTIFQNNTEEDEPRQYTTAVDIIHKIVDIVIETN